jgi:hypothetical protein
MTIDTTNKNNKTAIFVKKKSGVLWRTSRNLFVMNKNYVNEISFFREAERMSSCIEYSLSDCPSEFSWPGLAVLHPYVSLLKTIKSTICSEGKRFRDVLHKTPDFFLTKKTFFQPL